MGRMPSGAGPEAPITQKQVEAARAEVRQPPGQVGRLHELSRVLLGGNRGDQHQQLVTVLVTQDWFDPSLWVSCVVPTDLKQERQQQFE